jgi:hypothetical protein
MHELNNIADLQQVVRCSRLRRGQHVGFRSICAMVHFDVLILVGELSSA